jgi:hypothetical protein
VVCTLRLSSFKSVIPLRFIALKYVYSVHCDEVTDIQLFHSELICRLFLWLFHEVVRKVNLKLMKGSVCDPLKNISEFALKG